MSQAGRAYCGWFEIPGRQAGRRSLKEQMRGLDPALAAAAGKTVLDIGTAEGLIAMEFAKAGARSVYGYDYNANMIDIAKALALRLPGGVTRPRFEWANFSDVVRGKPKREFDIVLALAIVHKLHEPKQGVEYIASVCADLAVIRLPLGCDGSALRSKHTSDICDLNVGLRERGFRLEQVLDGPRHEAVQYWRRGG